MSDNKCQIERRGIIKRFAEQTAMIEIEGKEIPVPKEKLAPNLVSGDVVKWVGNHWTSVTGE
ncbi:hypothetical protein SD71_12380 [Cohnella kolymensis]|uniref:Uncharacterized protein n=1 Tax=Cohnella kolymensis TaxID=1590652 RepID=A0ABR5A3Q1_9BACL|nr:hypothetical protein [Cohnella kolymensis]KIL35684.1 hypothetical protein SD71_12380 [Cohnella kolymensis]